ncbi:MAG: hypothetical protein ACJ0QL_06080 [Parvicellaceae bacterium]
MLLKIKEKIHIKKHFKVPINKLLLELEKKKKISSIITICPTTTGNSWQGVYTATINLFPNSTFQIPQYFSNCIYTDQELKLISNKIVELKFDKIIFSGYCSYFSKLILAIKELNKKIEVFLIYHGSFATNSEDSTTSLLLKEILDLESSKQINKIGFVKKGMSESMRKIRNTNCSHILLSTDLRLMKYKTTGESKIRIGVLTHDQYRKNIHNQIAAALMVDKSIVHIKKNYNYKYFKSENRFVVDPFFESIDDFYKNFAKMTINTYVSFSECWGQLITESLIMGVPCLAANNSGIFDHSEFLKRNLIVNELDDSNSIYKQMQIVLENRDEISKKGVEYISLLNKLSDEKLKTFLYK